MKLTDNGPVYQISHIADIDNILGIHYLEEYVNNSSF